MRTIGIVSVGRSDYSYYLPILRRIKASPDLQLSLIVAGMHLSPEFGLTVKAIESDGFEIAERVEMTMSSDTSSGIAKSIGLGIIGFGQAFAHLPLDLLLLLGDRFEMFAAAAAMLPFAVPVVHIAGGEATEGLMDEAIRHSITKMSHLHFVSTQRYRERVIQMGEEPWRVIVSGAPSLDNLREVPLLTFEQTEQRIGFKLEPAPLLVTFHPVTLEYEDTTAHITELLAALEAADIPAIFTYPNADTQGRLIMRQIDRYVGGHKASCVVANLGMETYFSLLRYAAAMVGNSSSGIIEAASFELPVVNVGNRQRGRVHGRNVFDVPCERTAILSGIRQATDTAFRRSLAGMQNPYGDGYAAEKIVQLLRQTPLDRKLLVKAFYDMPLARVS